MHAVNSPLSPPVVHASYLAEHPHAVVADVRWYLDGRDGHAAYAAGHLPGAVWVDLDEHLAATGRPAIEGRHPLPTPAAFAASMSRLGIGDDSLVIAYDDTGGLTASRLVVMLRMIGHDAAVLDGGIGAWPGPLQVGLGPTPQPATFSPVPWPTDRLALADDLAALASSGGVVLDARSTDRFTGRETLVDPRPGHIPGARNAPWASVLAADGTFRTTDELRSHFHALGADEGVETITYCGSGVSACMNIVAMERAGFTPPRLYVASWSGWSADPDRKAALGA